MKRATSKAHWARIKQLEESGAHEIIRKLATMRRFLDGLETKDAGIAALVAQCRFRVDCVRDDIILSGDGRHYEYRNLEMAKALLKEINWHLKDQKRRDGASTGGKKSGETRREDAEEWQDAIAAEAKRLLSAGFSPEHIGARLNAKAGKSADRVAKFVRTLRTPPKKK